MPEGLAKIVKMFSGLPKEMLLPALLEYSKKVPALPEKYEQHPEFMQPVPECTSPFWLVTELKEPEQGGGPVALYFKVPQEAPTVRGYAGILSEGLAGASAEEILAVPDNFYLEMGLGKALTPMRLRGIAAILGRLKSDLRAKGAA